MTSLGTSSIVRSSKYRHISGKEYTRAERHTDINVGFGQKLSNTIKTNGNYFIIPYNTVGGVLGYRKIDDYGRWDEKSSNYGIVKAHKGKLSDFDFCPFNNRNEVLTASNSENVIKLWKLPEIGGNEENSKYLQYNEKDAFLELSDKSSSNATISRVIYHPYIDKSILSVQNEYLHFWDIEKSKIYFSLQNMTISGNKAPTLESISWSENSNLFFSGNSDRFIRVFDIRQTSKCQSSESCISTVEAHTSSKPFNIFYCGNGILGSVGFNKSGHRELGIYDLRKDLKCLQRLTIDNGAAVLTPFWDNDIKVLYLVGRGDGNIRFYELEDQTMYYLNDINTQSASAAVDWIPKWKVDVNAFELTRFLKLTNEKTVETISMRVLRKSNIENYFQEDIFPDTWNGEAIYTNWLDFEKKVEENTNKLGNENKVEDCLYLTNLLPPRSELSLKPEDKISIYDVPVNEGGKIRPTKSQPLIVDVETPTTPLENGMSASNNNGNGGNGGLIIDNIGSAAGLGAGTGKTISAMNTIVEKSHPHHQNSAKQQQQTKVTTGLNSKLNNNQQNVIPSILSMGLEASHKIQEQTKLPWYKRILYGASYYVGFSFFMLFKVVFISLPVYTYRKFTGYKPPAIEEEEMIEDEEENEENVPLVETNDGYTAMPITEDSTVTNQSHISNDNQVNHQNTAITNNNNNINNTSVNNNKIENGLGSEIGKYIMENYVGKLTREEIFPKRAHDKDPLLSQQGVLEIDVVDLKKGNTPVLLWVKGRKKTRACWVPCHWSSINPNDCFLLDCGKVIYIYNGQFSNKLCRAKTLDISSMIKFKERGGDAQVVIMDGGNYGGFIKEILSDGKNVKKSASLKSLQQKEEEVSPQLKKQMLQFWSVLGLPKTNATESYWLELYQKDFPNLVNNENINTTMKGEKYKTEEELSEEQYQLFNDTSQRLYKLNSEIFDQLPLQQGETQEDYISRISPFMLQTIPLLNVRSSLSTNNSEENSGDSTPSTPSNDVSFNNNTPTTSTTTNNTTDGTISLRTQQLLLGEPRNEKELNELIENVKNENIDVTLPSHKILQSDQCYIFENLFTKEVFFWSGKTSNLNARKWGVAISKKLSLFRVLNDNPFSLQNTNLKRMKKINQLVSNNQNNTPPYTTSKYGSTVTRVIEEGEHSIFKQKFSDYPGMLMIQTQKQESRGNVAEKKKQEKINFFELLLKRNELLKTQQNTTASSRLKMWRISDFSKIPYPHLGHFYSGDAFILLYSFTKVEGGKLFHKIYFWQGRDIRQKDKGTSAYKTVEIGEMIDEGVVENQIRVIQDKEPKEFLDLFLINDTASSVNATGGSSNTGGQSELASLGLGNFSSNTNINSSSLAIGEKAPKVPYIVHKGKYRPSVIESYEKENGKMTSSNSASNNNNASQTNLKKKPSMISKQQSSNSSTPTNNNNNNGNNNMNGEDEEGMKQPVGLFSNLSSNLNENEQLTVLTPQLIEYSKQMVEKIIKKSKYLKQYKCYDIKYSKIIECDECHPIYLNPFHCNVFFNKNWTVELNRKQLEQEDLNGLQNALQDQQDEPSLPILIYFGKHCKQEEKDFIQKNIIPYFINHLQSTESTDNNNNPENITTEIISENDLLPKVFSIDPCFEIYLKRYLNFLNGPINSHYLQLKTKLNNNITAIPYMYCITEITGNFEMSNVPSFSENDLISNQAYILDCLDLEGYLYIWMGKLCNTETKKFALSSAIEYYYTWKSNLLEKDDFYVKKATENNSILNKNKSTSTTGNTNTTTTVKAMEEENEIDPKKFIKQNDELNVRVVMEMEEPCEFTKHFLAWSIHSTHFKNRLKQLNELLLNNNTTNNNNTAITPRRTVVNPESNMPQNNQQKEIHNSGIFNLEYCSTASHVYTKLNSHETYSFEVLSSGVLPEGIDKSKLESYLSTEEFEKIFGMSKKKFYELKSWQQSKMKKEKNLF
ncbi:hypothetical protein ABK040_005066 [Willaertia magna]